ncbi:NADP-dependent aldehyde dehydrogenase [Chitinophaga skermanii]|uniref:NADP-dependent aldehyde dehydrogenase n=1 Tax=Chitinophaga skermanii TaxID=331697 RepID=A0A327QVW2_9BACT|nr:aldehyde dehydrogenase (NADP(+)) [Chitinophaga skermanii]RAJ08481.1 NADP-dependent aldehyde dehydrogenase [Chitinophaga skermanii]
MILQAFDPSTQSYLPGAFETATEAVIEQAVQNSVYAFTQYKQTTAVQRAVFLESIAQEILALGDTLLERAVAESGLPLARITGERGRTVSQLQLFANILREGSYVEAVIDTALPERQPLPRAAIRKMRVPIGPVVVFAASNFPLAFSTAGGDTVSALAAGNPVLLKAHPSHLGTNALVTTAIERAVKTTGMPNGVFASIVGDATVGQQLVQHPSVKAVGFTGSYLGGMAVFRAAQARTEPIPVFAEMGSVNPVLLLPSYLSSHAQQCATQFATSITQGVGQFCTSPGIFFVPNNADGKTFVDALQQALSAIPAGTMLNPGICEHYYVNRNALQTQPGVQALFTGDVAQASGKGSPALFSVTAKEFVQHAQMQVEVFGPTALVVWCDDHTRSQCLEALQGQLTGTVMANTQDLTSYAMDVHLLAEKVGRLIYNGVPTGVEVSYAMVHGGPFPATTAANSTSVGADAITRFTRVLCWQDCPDAFLPAALQDANPLHIWRKVDAQLTQAAL